MKKLLSIFATLLGATTALAGAVAYIAPEVAAIEEPARMGGSGAWIVPLVIASVIFLTLFKPFLHDHLRL